MDGALTSRLRVQAVCCLVGKQLIIYWGKWQKKN